MSPTAIKLMMWETFYDTAGHFVRDIAVLALVFVPIDMWKKQDFEVGHYVILGLFSLGFFIVGLALQCAASFVQNSREIWNAEEDLTT